MWACVCVCAHVVSSYLMHYHPFAVGRVFFSLDGLGGMMVVGMETLPAFHPAGKHSVDGR